MIIPSIQFMRQKGLFMKKIAGKSKIIGENPWSMK